MKKTYSKATRGIKMLIFFKNKLAILILTTTIATTLNSGIEEVKTSIKELMDRIEQAYTPNMISIYENGRTMVANDGLTKEALVSRRVVSGLNLANSKCAQTYDQLKNKIDNTSKVFGSDEEGFNEVKDLLMTEYSHEPSKSEFIIQKFYKLLASLLITETFANAAKDEALSKKMIVAMNSIVFENNENPTSQEAEELNIKIAEQLKTLFNSSLKLNTLLNTETQNLLLDTSNPALNEVLSIYVQAQIAHEALGLHTEEKDDHNLGTARLQSLADELSHNFFTMINDLLAAVSETQKTISNSKSNIAKESGVAEEHERLILDLQTLERAFSELICPKTSITTLPSGGSLSSAESESPATPTRRKRDIFYYGASKAWKIGSSSYNWLTGNPKK